MLHSPATFSRRSLVVVQSPWGKIFQPWASRRGRCPGGSFPERNIGLLLRAGLGW